MFNCHLFMIHQKIPTLLKGSDVKFIIIYNYFHMLNTFYLNERFEYLDESRILLVSSNKKIKN